MHLSRVLFPEPDRPSSATISPSRSSREMASGTGSWVPSGETKLLETCETVTMVVGSGPGPVGGWSGRAVIGDHPPAPGRPGTTRTKTQGEQRFGGSLRPA